MEGAEDAEEADDVGEHGRRETEQERLDRKWADVLQELRVMQTGVQLLAGFLLTLPFQPTFTSLDLLQETLYLTLVAIAGATTLAVVTPVVIHRHLTGQQVKERVVSAGQVALHSAVAGVGLLVVGLMTFIFDVVVGRTAGLVVCCAGGLVALLLFVVLPRRLARDEQEQEDPEGPGT
jgi:hypothetical protein